MKAKTKARPDYSTLPTVDGDKEYTEALAKLEEIGAELPVAEREAKEAAERFEWLNKGIALGEATVEQVNEAELESARAERKIRGLRGAIIEAEKRVTTAHAAAVRKILPEWRSLHQEHATRYAAALREIAAVLQVAPRLVSAFRHAAALPSAGGDGLDSARRFLPLRFRAHPTDGQAWTNDARSMGFVLPAWPEELRHKAVRDTTPKPPRINYPDLYDLERGDVVFRDLRGVTPQPKGKED